MSLTDGYSEEIKQMIEHLIQTKKASGAVHVLPGVSDRDRILCAAVSLGKAMKDGQLEIAASGALILASLISKEDIKWTQDTMLNSWKNCGCEQCQEELKVIDAIKAENKKPEPTEDLPEDPFKSFAM